jgi:hypothetical protein
MKIFHVIDGKWIYALYNNMVFVFDSDAILQIDKDIHVGNCISFNKNYMAQAKIDKVMSGTIYHKIILEMIRNKALKDFNNV